MTAKAKLTHRNRLAVRVRLGVCAVLLGTVGMSPFISESVSAQGIGVKDSTNAKIARTKVRLKLQENEAHRRAKIEERANGSSNSDSDSASGNSSKQGCSSLNIGNATGTSPGRRQQKVEVIIIGDVINGIGDC